MAYTNIDDPSAHFQTLLWTGNDVDGRALTNDGNSDLQPDLVWLKNRNVGYNHFLQDSSRGTSVYLSSNTTTGDTTWTNLVESFDTNGFTVGDDGSQVPNHTGNTFVGWQWKANGGTTASNSDGSITSTVQANQDAGFSIVQYTGTGSAATIGHGLGVAPAMYIVKNRDQTGTNWTIFHKNLTSNAYSLYFNTAAQSNSVGYWNGTSPTSTVFSIKNTSGDVNTNTEDYVAYCFAEKQGYSKFGKYVGNGSTDGNAPFVYTGFKPAFVMIKNASASTNWYMWDNKRNPYNVVNNGLNANTSNATQGTAYDTLDFLSNGFKIRDYADGTWNGSGNTIIYMAFAESSFVSSQGIPTTAR
jgi:hypothetical protein